MEAFPKENRIPLAFLLLFHSFCHRAFFTIPQENGGCVCVCVALHGINWI